MSRPTRRPAPPSKTTQNSKQPTPRKNTKVTGERSEAAFLNRASDQGFGVAKPWGDSLRYDFILDNGSRLLRIQVKCTESIRAHAYETRATYSVGKGRAVYTTKDIDFIAAHIVPLDIWYIIPVEICTPAPMLRFYPHRQAKKMRLEPYREAWHLVLPKQSNEVMEIQASADEVLFENASFETVEEGVAILSEPKYLCTSPAAPTYMRSSSVAEASASARLKHFRQLCKETKPVSIPQSAAPWPIPPVRILATRKGKRILSNAKD
jgi:hypothetical protein